MALKVKAVERLVKFNKTDSGTAEDPEGDNNGDENRPNHAINPVLLRY